MRLRSYLVLSYLAIILVMSLGMWVIFDVFMDELTSRTLNIADTAVGKVTAANVKASGQILTQMGEDVVRDKAEDVARELGYLLKGRKSYDYRQLRQDPKIRRIAIQEIHSADGLAGYTDVYDRNGYILFHPDKNVEGRNQLNWESEYPETTEMIRRSLTEDKVAGYFNFFDVNKRPRQRFSYRVHVPGTPFIVGAIVNLDVFFQPTQAKIQKAGQEVIAQAEKKIAEHHTGIENKIKLGGLAAALVLSLLGGLAGIWFAGTIARPISRLRDGVQQVGEGDFSVTVPERGVMEVMHLAQSFNRLGEQLVEYIEKRDFIRDTFGRYVTQEVVKKLLEDKAALEMGGETREVSIIMSDLRGFTAIIADMHPEQVILFLNRYLGKMIEILLDNRAVIDEIVGDGILAFLGAPEPMEDHPARAVACALQMQAAMEEINASNAADGLPHLEMGIAVNTGAVVVGNIGSERRTKYSVVGSHVNFTSRMESYALAGQVLISPSTYGRVQDLVEVRDAIKVEMKGMPEAATLYDVRALGAPYNLRLADASTPLVLLPKKINILVARLQDKIVTGVQARAWITHLCDRAATVAVGEKLEEWEDVRLTLLDASLNEVPGHIYGKVTMVKPTASDLFEAAISFTSVSPQVYQILRKAGDEA